MSVARPSGAVETYTYGPDGLRRRKDAAGQGRIFVWQGQNLLIETNAGLVTQAQYTDPPGIWGGLVSQRRGDVSHFFGFDLQENTRLLVPVGGVVTDTETYKAFGERLAATGTTERPQWK